MKEAGDLDGRGTYYQKNLVQLLYFFLKVSIDQIDYMSSIHYLNEFIPRLERYAERNQSQKFTQR